MRQLLLVFAALASLGCGKDSPAAPEPARVRWTLSATTCQGSGDIHLIVDGSIVGTETMAAGQTSQIHDVTPGQHFIEARTVVQPGIIWDSFAAVTIPSGQLFTRILEC